MRIPFKLLFIGLAGLASLAAQEIKLPPSFDRLASKASEVVDINLDSSLLQLAARFLSDRDADEARVKKLVTGLKSVMVKCYEFDRDNEYQESDVQDLRKQLSGPGWSRIVGVRSRRNGDNADVFIKSETDRVTGLAVIVAEPRQLVIVNIVGAINPDELRDLGGHFGIPKLEFDRKSRPRKEDHE
jgi:hypothetical protein